MLVSFVATNRRSRLFAEVTILAVAVAWFFVVGSVFASDKSLSVYGINTMPLSFTQNNGQWNEQVAFRANAGGFTGWFGREGLTYQFTRRTGRGTLRVPDSLRVHARRPYSIEGLASRLRGNDMEGDSVEQLAMTAKFIGANPNPQVLGEELMEYKCNYFIGNDPTKWRRDVPNYQSVVYKDIYPGIDLKYYGSGDGRIEYDFIISPNANPSQIAIRYDGADEVCVDNQGQLVVETEWGEVTERAPVVWQVVDGDIREISANYVQKEGGTFGFELDKGYKPEYAVVVDPVLSYSTYLAASESEFCIGVGVDASGMYVGGNTYSSDFPMQNPFQGMLYSGSDAFVTKLNKAGDALIYSTYIGGDDDDFTYGFAVDQGGHAYVVGETRSTDFPTHNAFQSTNHGISNVFITKLSTGGDSLSYSTYLGGTSLDYGEAVAVDNNGNAYVNGISKSANFPLKNPIQATVRGEDAFVTRMGAAGDSLIYSTRLGGSAWDDAFGIAVDKTGAAYITGETRSTNYPTLNAFQETYGGGLEDAFVTKLNSTGSALVFSTYLGGNDQDGGYGIAVDTSCNVYVTGETSSTNFPTVNAVDSVYQGGIFDAFATKLDSAGNTLRYSTFLGGSDRDIGFAITADHHGNAYITGLTNSSDFPAVDAYQTTNQGSYSSDAFLSKLTPEGIAFTYSTYLGGSKEDVGEGIAIDGIGNVYVSGNTVSPNFPIKNGYQQSPIAWDDLFVTKFRESKCGDADGSHDIDIADVVYLINYIFSGGPAPNPLVAGDADCSGDIDIADVVYLIAYIFSGGPEPCAKCK
jgi:hypothetical protein